MAQADLNLQAGISPAEMRIKVNQALPALATNFSGSTEPSPSYPFQFWPDTASGLWKVRNAANSAWIVVGKIGEKGLGILNLERLYYRLNSPNIGADSSAAQSIFNVGVFLEAATTYEFQLQFNIQKSAGISNHSVSIQFDSTATFGDFAFFGHSSSGVGSGALLRSPVTLFASSAGSVTITADMASAITSCAFSAVGSFTTQAAGSLIPKYKLSAAPGGAYSTQSGSYISIRPVGQAGNINLGGWS
jgi:hypothetical protein